MGGYRRRGRMLLAVGGVLLLALAVRTLWVGQAPFQSLDDIRTAWFTVWLYPRGLESLRVGDSSVLPNPLGIVTLDHGPLQVAIATVWVAWLSMFSIRVTELMWHLPFALLGSLTALVSYCLGFRLQSRRAGLLSALFVSVLPLHVAFSRTSGESHFILAALLQASAVLLWYRYLTSGLRRFALLAGVVAAADGLTDYAFPGLVVTMFLMGVIRHRHYCARRSLAVVLALSDLLQWRFLLPMIVPLAVHAYGIQQTIRVGHGVGMFGRLLDQSQAEYTDVGGVFAGSVAANLVYTTNIAVVVVALGLSAAFAYRSIRRREIGAAIVPLLWMTVQLLPFVFLVSRERLVGHYPPVSVAMAVFVSLELDAIWTARRAAVLVRLLAGVLFLSLLATTLGMVFGISVPPPFRRPVEHGGVRADRGTKAAAVWIRQNTSEDARIFADPFAGQGHFAAMYYYHRPVVSLELGLDTTVEGALSLLAANLRQIDGIVVGSEHRDLLPSAVEELFVVRAEVRVDGRPSLVVMTRDGGSTPEPQILDAEALNTLYDELYAGREELIALPLQEIVDFQSKVVRD